MKIIYYDGLSMDGSGERCGLSVLSCCSIAPGRGLANGSLLADIAEPNTLFAKEFYYEVIPLANVLRIVNDDVDTSPLENLPDLTKEGWKTV